MKNTILFAAVPAMFALSACGETATEEPAETAIMDDDNDAPAPVAEPIAEEEPHDESVPHEH